MSSTTTTESPLFDKGVRRKVFYIVICILVVSTLFSQSFYLEGWSSSSTTTAVSEEITAAAIKEENNVTLAPTTKPPRYHPKIAIIASHIPSSQTADSSRVKLFDHVVNKACYSYLWGYDFIFNMTPGFTKNDTIKAPWLEFGTWHRVPHIASQLPNYDWVLYTDVDYVFADMSRPLESFFQEFKLYGKNPSVFVPTDMPGGYHTFSAFAVMIKNSPFGRRMVDNWMKFGHGVCPNGNMPKEYDKDGNIKYGWEHSDQPGIWYSFVQTHRQFYFPDEAKQFYPPNNHTIYCNTTTGFIETDRNFGPEINQYFRGKKVLQGGEGEHLDKVADDQPIIWSNVPSQGGNPLNGLGFQMTYAVLDSDTRYKNAFALHKKNKMSDDFHRELKLCKTKHGCYANYTEDGQFQIGCKDTKFAVPSQGWK